MVRRKFESELRAEGKGRNGYSIAGGMDRWSRTWTRPSRRDLARFRALNYMCVWNGIACIFKAGESNSCARIRVCIIRALTFRSFSRPAFLSSFSPFLALSFIRIMNKYICRILTRVHGAWYARSVDQTRPESGRSVFSISPRMHLCETCHENVRSVCLTPSHHIFLKTYAIIDLLYLTDYIFIFFH